MSESKLKSVLLDLSTPEEEEDFIMGEIDKLITKLEGIEKRVDERVKDHDHRVSLVINETDQKVNEYLSGFKEKMSAKIRELDKIVAYTKDRTDVVDLSLNRDIQETKKEIKEQAQSFISKIKSERDQIMGLVSDVVKSGKESQRLLKRYVEETRDSLREEFGKEIKSVPRGGSIPLQVSANGTLANSKYADINLIGASASNNDTTHKTDITINGFSPVDATGVIDTQNTVFSVSTIPIAVFADGRICFENFDYTRSGLTITMSFPPQQYVKYI